MRWLLTRALLVVGGAMAGTAAAWALSTGAASAQPEADGAVVRSDVPAGMPAAPAGGNGADTANGAHTDDVARGAMTDPAAVPTTEPPRTVIPVVGETSDAITSASTPNHINGAPNEAAAGIPALLSQAASDLDVRPTNAVPQLTHLLGELPLPGSLAPPGPVALPGPVAPPGRLAPDTMSGIVRAPEDVQKLCDAATDWARSTAHPVWIAETNDIHWPIPGVPLPFPLVPPGLPVTTVGPSPDEKHSGSSGGPAMSADCSHAHAADAAVAWAVWPYFQRVPVSLGTQPGVTPD
jgi:hypothetical protein